MIRRFGNLVAVSTPSHEKENCYSNMIRELSRMSTKYKRLAGARITKVHHPQLPHKWITFLLPPDHTVIPFISERCGKELISFLLMFMILLCGYADVGNILFGEESENYHSFSESLSTLFRTILGDFEYDELRRANRNWAAVFFITYILLVFFVLVNMFLAIISDSYSEVKTEIAIAPDQIEVWEYFKNMCLKCCKRKLVEARINEYKAIINEIRKILSSCGYSDMDIQMFFTRFNLDPYAKDAKMNQKDILKALERVGLEAEKVKEDIVRPQEFFGRMDRLEEIEASINALLTKIDVLTTRISETAD